MVLYLLLRDAVFRGRNLGKLLMRLIVIDEDTFTACTLRQSLIRNVLYASVCPALLLVGAAALGVASLFIPVILLLLAFTRSDFSPLFFIGYDPDNGRTIPDSWAKTHVLTPKEVATMVRLRNELNKALQRTAGGVGAE